MITKQHPDGRIEILNPFDVYLDPGPEILSMTVTPIAEERNTATEVRLMMAVRERQLQPVYAQLRANIAEMAVPVYQMVMMKELARDPRIEPKEGDELHKPRRRNGKMLYRRVTYRRNRSQRRRNLVVFAEHGGGATSAFKSCSLSVWQAWAKGAQVKPRFPGATA